MGSLKCAKNAKKATNVHSYGSKVNLEIEFLKLLRRQETTKRIKKKFCQSRVQSPCGWWIKNGLMADDFSLLSYLSDDKKVFLEDIPEFRCGIPVRGEVYRIRLQLFDINYLEYDGRNKLGVHRFRLYGDGLRDIVDSLRSGASKLSDHVKCVTERISESLNETDFFIIHDDGKIKFSARKSLKGLYGTLRLRYTGDYQRIIIYFPHIQKAILLVKKKGQSFESSIFIWYKFLERDEQAHASDAILGFTTTTVSF